MSLLKSVIVLFVLSLCLFACKTKRVATTATMKQVVYFTSKDAAKNYFKRGVDVNYAEPKYGWTALIMAAEAGNYEVAKYLIAKGADVNKVSKEKEVTALNRAAMRGHLKLVELLIKHGAEINHQDKLGSTPLMRAAYSGHTDVVQALITKKAMIDVRANRGESAILLAVANEQIEVVKLLLAYGANTERPSVLEETPLSTAKKLNNATLIELLSTNTKK